MNLPVTPVLDILIKLINFNLNLIIVAWGYSVDLFFFSLYQLPLVGTPWIFHVYYDRGDNLPHDQIRCHVTEAKINTVLITIAICKRQKNIYL